AGAGGRLLSIGEERLPERDWLAENRRDFPPQRIGRFFIHGSHWHGRAAPSSIPIEIDAATAFGTGEHPSTRGCLLALDRLARRRRFRRPLDIGTGSGILAIAAAKRLRRPVVAGDIDPEAVRVARHHARRNGLASRARFLRTAGYRRRALRRHKYDLILANILARPLALMARDLKRTLAPGLRVETLGDGPDLGAADAGIGKRVIVERHQLGIGALAIPPALPGITRSDEKVDQRHHKLLTTRMVHCKKWELLHRRTIQK